MKENNVVETVKNVVLFSCIIIVIVLLVKNCNSLFRSKQQFNKLENDIEMYKNN